MEKASGAAAANGRGPGLRPFAASAGAMVFLLGFAAPLVVAFGSRWLALHAEKVARDTAPLLLLLVFAAFTVFALRLLPGRRWLAVAALYAGATLGTAAEVLFSDPGRRLVVEILVIWWLAAPAVVAGILLEQVWRGKRRATNRGGGRA